MTLLSWNVAGRVERQPEQTDLIAEFGADLVCLQEITPTTTPAWTTALREAGWEHVAVTPSAGQPAGPAADCPDGGTRAAERAADR